MKRYSSTYKVIHDDGFTGMNVIRGHMEESDSGEFVKHEDIKDVYQSLLTILYLKAADEYDDELWTKAWADAVSSIRKANGDGTQKD